MSARVLWLGSHQQSFHCLRHLFETQPSAKLIGVVPHQTQPPIGPNEDVRELAAAHGAPVLAHDDIFGLDYDLGVSLLYDRLLPPDVFDAPPRGFVNVHMAPLPRFRGANGVLHAVRLARQDDHWKFGVTMHYIDAKVDTGPIIDLIEVPILETDTAYDLHARAAAFIPDLFARNIGRLLETPGRVPAAAQSGKAYYFKRGGVNAEVDLTASPEEIYDTVRALSFPGKGKPYAMIGPYKIYLSIKDE